jgi:hypothetical protein
VKGRPTCELVGKVEEVRANLHLHRRAPGGLCRLFNEGNERVGHGLCAEGLPRGGRRRQALYGTQRTYVVGGQGEVAQAVLL